MVYTWSKMVLCMVVGVTLAGPSCCARRCGDQCRSSPAGSSESSSHRFEARSVSAPGLRPDGALASCWGSGGVGFVSCVSFPPQTSPRAPAGHQETAGDPKGKSSGSRKKDPKRFDLHPTIEAQPTRAQILLANLRARVQAREAAAKTQSSVQATAAPPD